MTDDPGGDPLRFDQALLTEIRDRIDLVALIGASVALKKAGTAHKGLCPFHDEKTASFTVSDVRRTYHCFGCGAHGDVFEWMVEHEGLGFVEAVQQLAERARVALPEAEPAPKKTRKKRSRQPGRSSPAADASSADASSADTSSADASSADVDAGSAEPVGLAAGFTALELEGDDAPSEPPPAAPLAIPLPDVLPLFDVADLTRMWGQLGEVPATWASAVRTWAIERGLGPVVADILPSLGEVAAVPVGRVPRDLAEMVASLRWEPLDLWVPVRDVEGSIVDIQRRYVRGGKAPAGLSTKTARLKHTQDGDRRPQIPTPPETVLFGRISAAVEAAARGEPVIIVEGEADYLLAAACCVARGRGVALGIPGGKAHRKVASALVLAVQKHRRRGGGRITPGSWDCYVVPDIDDNGGGERAMWSAGVQLLDVARVTWCPPARRVVDDATRETRLEFLSRGDLTDAVKGCRDPIGAVWELLEAGARMFESVDAFESDVRSKTATLARWRGASDAELEQAFYRLPWRDVVEYMRWYVPLDEQNQPMPPVRSFYHSAIDHRDGTDRVQDMMNRWLEAQRITFISARAFGRDFVWDPWTRATLKPRARSLPRLVQVGARKTWLGWIGTVLGLNPKQQLGGTLNMHLQQLAQAAHGVTLKPWITADGGLRRPRVRVHLHGPNENVVSIRRGCIAIEPNSATASSLLVALDEHVTPIEWVATTTPTEAARLLWDTIGQHITVSHRERVLAMSWALMTFVRELVTTRPILWGTGMSESGKSFLGRLLMGLITGRPFPGTFSVAALWEAATIMPLLSKDNEEARHLGTDAEQFLLIVSTTGNRYRRAEGDYGLVMQDGRPMVHLSAISRPNTREMQRRCIVLQHDPQYLSAGMRASEVLDALLAARSKILSGVARAFADYIIPRLEEPVSHEDGRRHHEVYADCFPLGHPSAGMREALGIMGVIGTWLCEADPRWGRGGLEMCQGWAKLLEQRATSAARHTDPLAAALDELVFVWNQVKVDNFGQSRRPAFDDGTFQCKPVFETQPQHNPTGNEAYTTTMSHGEVPAGGGPPVVVGFEGTYPQLYRDLKRVADRSFEDVMASGDDVRTHIRQVDSWQALGEVRRWGPRRLRVYRWVQADGPDITEEEEQ